MSPTKKKKGRGRPIGSRSQERPIPSDRLYLRPKEVARVLGLGLSTVYDGIYRGTIPSRKVGHALLVPRSYIENGQQCAASNNPSQNGGVR